MKKIKLLISFVIISFLVSCSDNDDVMPQEDDSSEVIVDSDLLSLIGTNDIDTLYIDTLQNTKSRTRVYGGKYSAGKPNNLTTVRNNITYYLPSGYSADDIVATAISGQSNYVFTYFKNGKVIAGSAADLEKYVLAFNYSLPPGYSWQNIVGIGIDGGNNKVFTWFSNYKRTVGNSSDLDYYGGTKNYTIQPLGSGELDTWVNPAAVIDMAIDGSSDATYVWFRNYDGKIGCVYGSTTNMWKYYSTNAKIMSGKTIQNIKGIGFDGFWGGDYAFAYYN